MEGTVDMEGRGSEIVHAVWWDPDPEKCKRTAC